MRILHFVAAVSLFSLANLSPLSAVALGISVSPATSMADRPISIRVSASPGERVRVRLMTQRYGMTFASSATFIAPKSGAIDLAQQAPISGSYSGSDGMGLFWSAVPGSDAPKPYEFRRDIDLDARHFTLVATDGSQSATASGTRLTLSPDDNRRVVDSGSLVATLFASKTKTCEPGVIVLGGSEGGVPEEEAAVLAAHGFTTLALAYFGAPELPQMLTDIPIESVQRAAVFMQARHEVCRDRRIALIGSSKGAELALLAASKFDVFGAVVAVSPASIVFGGIGTSATDPNPSSWSYRGKALPFANGKVPDNVVAAEQRQRKTHEKVSYRDDYLAQLQNNTEPSAPIPVEQIGAPVLVVAGGADQLWPSEFMARQIAARLKLHKHSYPDELLVCSAAGHQIGTPYQFPIAELAYAGLALGGSGLANERADETSWPKILAFLREAK